MRRLLTLGCLLLAACSQPAPDPRSAVSRPQLDAAGQPALFAELTALGSASLMRVKARSADVVTWVTPEGVSLSFRDGVLIGSRGLGQDLISADVEKTLVALAQGDGGYYPKFHAYLDGENQTQFRTFQCLIADRIPETITIVQRTHATTRVEETCVSPGLDVTNRYWLRDGVMWKSQQWVSPFAGYLLTERLVR